MDISTLSRRVVLLILLTASPLFAGEAGPTYELRPAVPVEVQSADGLAPELTLRWLELNDSRCPEGVQCIVAGQAQLRIEAVRTGHDPEEIILVLAAGRRLGDHDAEEQVGDFHVELVAVDPYPVAGVTVDEANRSATLHIERRDEPGSE